MKIETESREDHQIRIVAEFEPEILERYKQQAARKISREAKIPGFRPGKAPMNVIRRMFGDEAIDKEAVELMVDAVYPDVLKEANVEPAYPGTLEDILSTDPPKFAFLIPLKPTVDLGDYRLVREEYTPEAVSDEEMENYLKRVRTGYATAEPVERPAQKGDLVAARVTGTLTSPDEGQEAEFIHPTPMQTVIDDPSISPDTWPYPGFSKELAGLSANDEKDVTYVYPEDFESEPVRGKEIVFHIQVQSVKTLTVPELDDEFAKTLGDFETIEDFKTSTRASLEARKRESYDSEYFDRLLDKVVEQATINFPPQMLAEEEDSVLHRIEHNLADQKLDLETYLKVMNMDRDAFIEKEVRPTALRRLKNSLVLDQLARDEKIEVKDKELQEAFNQTISEISASGELQEIQRRNKAEQQRIADAIAYEAANRAMQQRVFNRLKSIATGQPEADEEEAEADSETEIPAIENDSDEAASQPAAEETPADPTSEA